MAEQFGGIGVCCRADRAGARPAGALPDSGQYDSAGGGHPVDTTSELLGYDGFKRQNISALALIKDRYGERIDEARLIERLSKSGIVALNQQAKAMKEATGNPADQCYAHAMIQFYNQRNAHRVDPWWNLSVVGVA